jgi:hypothetical protein
MLRKIMQSMMALTLALGVAASSIAPAEARHGRGLGIGIAAGIIGLGIIGAYGHHRDRYYSRADDDECYPGPEECGFVNRHCFYNTWGDYVCRGGRWTCWRRNSCD